MTTRAGNEASPTSVIASASSFTTITNSDSTVVSFRALYVGVGGDITLQTGGGTSTLFTAVPQGTILPCALYGGKVMATGTTASALVGLDW